MSINARALPGEIPLDDDPTESIRCDRTWESAFGFSEITSGNLSERN